MHVYPRLFPQSLDYITAFSCKMPRHFNHLTVPQIYLDAEQDDVLSASLKHCRINPSLPDNKENRAYYCDLQSAPGAVVGSVQFGPCFPILMYKREGDTVRGAFVHMYVEGFGEEQQSVASMNAVMREMNIKKLTVNLYTRLNEDDFDAFSRRVEPDNTGQDNGISNFYQVKNIAMVAGWLRALDDRPKQFVDRVNIVWATRSDHHASACQINLRHPNLDSPDAITWRRE